MGIMVYSLKMGNAGFCPSAVWKTEGAKPPELDTPEPDPFRVGLGFRV